MYVLFSLVCFYTLLMIPSILSVLFASELTLEEECYMLLSGDMLIAEAIPLNFECKTDCWRTVSM